MPIHVERFACENKITLLSEISEELLVTWKKEVLMRATATTWNNYHTHLRALLNFSVRKNWINENYLLNIPKARKPKLKKKTIELEALAKIFHTLDKYQVKLQPKWFWSAVIKALFLQERGKTSWSALNSGIYTLIKSNYSVYLLESSAG